MGLRLSVVTLSDANIERILADPPLIWRVLIQPAGDALSPRGTAG